VGGDPGAVVVGEVNGFVAAGPPNGVEAGGAGEADDGVGVVALRLVVEVGDEDVQGGALDFGECAGAFGQEGGQELERGRRVVALQLDGANGFGGQPFEVGLGADAPRLVLAA